MANGKSNLSFSGIRVSVRVVKVKTDSGVFTRPLQRLYPLKLCGLEEKEESDQLSDKNIRPDKDDITQI